MKLMLKFMRQLIIMITPVVILLGCGISNNVGVNLINGQCPNGIGNAPYCMAVQIVNNGGGQNFINSTNFPISNISLTISNVPNIASPATSSSQYDPNGCLTSTIAPGGSCTFYLQLTGEAFPVASYESAQVILNYTVNNTLFGGSTTTGNYPFNAYEITNLYVMQQNGYLTVNNAAWTLSGLVESNDVANTIAVDTSQYGVLYIGGNQGIYPYSISQTALYSSITASNTNVKGSNNLLISSGTMYTTNIPSTGNNQLFSYTLNIESWANTYQAINNSIWQRTITLSNGTILFSTANSSLSNTPTNIIYYCNNNLSSSYSCSPEGINGLNLIAVYSLGVATTGTESGNSYTGLYAGGLGEESDSLYIESGSMVGNPSNAWSAVTSAVESNSFGRVNVLANANDSLGNALIVAGDSNGKLWVVNATTSPTIAYPVVIGNQDIAGAIVAMTFDQFSSTLYVATGTNVYACSGIGSTATNNFINASCTNLNIPINGNGPIVNLAIGSFLANSLNAPTSLLP
ncbi:MAG: hypothetical protein RL017_158 [Pseudomonadota bacterium]|jgi:hypothetical protein